MKALLVDDHPLILAALQSVIAGLGDHVGVTGAASAREARETLARSADYDLVLLDLQLGDADGFDLLTELRAAYPALPVVVLSASDRTSDVIRAIDLGAMGFVSKRSSNETLFEALRMVMSGGIFVPTMALEAMAARRDAPGAPHPETAGEHLDLVRQTAAAGAYAQPPKTLAAIGITPRQTDVLALLLRGQSNKLIARELNLSVETVKDHVAAVLRALNVNSRTQAVLAVSQMAQQPLELAVRRGGAGGAPPEPRR
jgi:DNA-binding NarL/FixJ family response regulator